VNVFELVILTIWHYPTGGIHSSDRSRHECPHRSTK